MGRAARIAKDRARQSSCEVGSQGTFGRALEALRTDDTPIAIALLRQTLLEDPGHVDAHVRLATTLREQGLLPDAVVHYEKAIALRPRHAEAMVNLAETLRRAGRIAEALSYCDRALADDAYVQDGHVVRGVARFGLGDHYGAIGDLTTAIAAAPKVAAPYKILGKMLMETERTIDALAILRKACLLSPTDGELFRYVGDLCTALGQTADGFAAYQKAIELDPYNAFIYANLSGLLCKTTLLDVALSVADVGLKIAPNLSGLHYNRAVALEKRDRLDEAVHAYAEALRCDPDSGEALTSICRLRGQICDWDGLSVSEGLARTLTYRKGRKTSPFGMLPITSSLGDILTCNKVWAKTLERGDPALAPYAPRAPHRRQDRLRIGYLSADFHSHATAALIAELFELHDTSRFETWGYSIGPHDSGSMRQRLVEALGHFEDLTALSHDAAAARIHADQIDILVDLKGYTFQSRAEILARRPAPIQVNFLGYPSTMGATFIDYIIGDPVVTPMDHQPFYSERIVQLPNSYQPNDRLRPIAAQTPTRADCGLPEDAFVFCCFNANYKITPAVFDIWMRLLRARSESVLWLYEANRFAAANLRAEAGARGVDPARIVFAPKRSAPDHLARMTLGDLFLDTSPYGAHTTASEALWAGVPVLTYRGEAFSARVGASLVSAVGLPDLATETLAEYEATARHLADHPRDLATLRSRLAETKATAPLFDSPRYARDFENALARMAEIRDAGERPKAFAV